MYLFLKIRKFSFGNIKTPFVLFFLFLQLQIYSQQSNITFEHFSIDQGMYETNINSVIQDKTGYLWFGTWGGIEKYDGYNFTAYKQEPDNPNSIKNQFVNTLYEDKEGNIWVGTWRGLEKFNQIKRRIHTLQAASTE